MKAPLNTPKLDIWDYTSLRMSMIYLLSECSENLECTPKQHKLSEVYNTVGYTGRTVSECISYKCV